MPPRAAVSAAAAAAAAATVATRVAFKAGQRTAYVEDESCDLGDCTVQLRPLPPPRADGKRTAAFFDVDGTLYHLDGDPTGAGTALIHLFRVSRAHSTLRGAAYALLIVPIVLALFSLDKFAEDRVFSMWFMTTRAT